MLQASEVQEVQVQVEEEQEKARTLESIVASLRSDLLLAREEQERLQERLQLQEKEAVESRVGQSGYRLQMLKGGRGVCTARGLLSLSIGAVEVAARVMVVVEPLNKGPSVMFSE